MMRACEDLTRLRSREAVNMRYLPGLAKEIILEKTTKVVFVQD